MFGEHQLVGILVCYTCNGVRDYSLPSLLLTGLCGMQNQICIPYHSTRELLCFEFDDLEEYLLQSKTKQLLPARIVTRNVLFMNTVVVKSVD